MIAVTVAIAIMFWLFDWNMLRGPISRYVGHKLDRHVAIDGNLAVNLSWKPLIQIDDVILGNAAWSSDPVMLQTQRFSFRVDLSRLLHGRLTVVDLTLVKPRLLLERAADGRANWQFGGATPPAGAAPQIEGLSIDDGVVHYRDAMMNADVTAKVGTIASAANDRSRIGFSGSGHFRKEPFTIEGQAASLLALRDRDATYALNVSAQAGTTSVHYDGSLVPSNIEDVNGDLTLKGRDLSRLYPIIPAPLPWTPPYQLSGHLRHDKAVWSFNPFTGKVGDSDLAGSFALDKGGDRPIITADLTSKLLNYQDLGGFVGLPPTQAPPQARTAEQNRDVAKRAASARVLPTSRFHPERLRAADMRVRFRGERIMASSLPLDNLDTRLDLTAGVLKLQPLDFGVAGGHVVSNMVIDARGDTIKLNGDLIARNLELKKLIPPLKTPGASAGKVGGRAKLLASGNSVADLLASSNGQLALLSWGGEASTLTLVLSNLDLARAAQLLLRGDEKSPIRCAVADFEVKQGKMNAQTLLIDTEAEKIVGSGTVDFASETYDLRFEAKSKHASLLALRGPILVDGSFKTPHIHPAVGPLATRVGTSVALGVLLTPLAALLPLIDTGGATDANCHALINDAQRVVNK